MTELSRKHPDYLDYVGFAEGILGHLVCVFFFATFVQSNSGKIQVYCLSLLSFVMCTYVFVYFRCYRM